MSPEEREQHSTKRRANATRQWAARTEADKEAVRQKIAQSLKARNASRTPEQIVAEETQLAKARESINHTYRKQRQKEALQAYWTPERRAEFSAKRKSSRLTNIVNAGPRNRFLVSGRIVSNSGRLVQPQNLGRTPKFLDPEKSSERLDTVTDLIRQGDYEIFPLLVEEPMAVFGGTMRGMFRASARPMLHICEHFFDRGGRPRVGVALRAMLNVFRSGRDIYRDFGVAL